MKKYYTIYKTTNKNNNHFYIGSHITKNLNDSYLGSGKVLKQAIKKYGLENFNKEILFIFENETEMFLKEKELLSPETLDLESCYNLCEGGKGGFTYLNTTGLNKRNSEEASELAKRGHIEGWFSAKGRKLSEEHKRKIRDFNKTINPERSAKIRKKLTGRVLSAELKEKISKGVKEKIKQNHEDGKGSLMSLEGRLRISDANRKRVWSEDTKNKISVSLKLSYLKRQNRN